MRRFWLGMLYDFGFCLALLLMLPRFLWQVIRGKRTTESLWERLGGGIVPIEKGNRPLVWVHAVSLGETKAVAPLVDRLRSTLPDPIFVISSVTATGHAEAIRAMPFADRHLYLPLDLGWIMRRVLRKLVPDLVVVTETDYWYHFLDEAKALGAKLVVVNGKLSEKSTARYSRLSFFSTPLFQLFDRVCVQSSEYCERFEAVGVDAKRLSVTGNLKFDATLPRLALEELAAFRQKLDLNKEEFVITGGSTHDPEERFLLQACRELWVDFPHVKLLLVPRHPERFDDVARMLISEGIPFRRFSDSVPSRGEIRVVLVDAMGVLKECYQISQLAVVAGSFTPRIGGHNLLEPCHYGIPVLFGPYMHAQPELERLVLAAGAGIQVKAEELSQSLRSLIQDKAQRERISQAGMNLVTANRGAIERTLDAIQRG